MDDFRSVIQTAQPGEFTNVFGDNKGGNLIGQKTAPDHVADPLKVLYFSKVFIIWKPYGYCSQCSAALNAGEAICPDDSAYTCPHTNNREYEETINLCLTGKALLQKQDFVDLKDGTRIAHVMWLIADPKHVEEMKKKKEAADKEKVYPPNPAKVFAEEDQKRKAEPAKATDSAENNTEGRLQKEE